MPHSLGLIKNRTDLFSGFWERLVQKVNIAISKDKCQLDFEITMDTFLVPLPATTSGSAPENKQFYFLYFDTICWHAIRHNLQKSVPPPAIGSSYVKLRFIFDTIDGMFYTECTSKSQTYAVVIVKLFIVANILISFLSADSKPRFVV